MILKTVRAEIAIACATGLFLGIASGLAVDLGQPAVPIASIVAILVVVGVVRMVAPAAMHERLAMVLVLALAIRLAAAAVLFAGSMALGHGGFITGDDHNYATLAWAFAEYLHGRPVEPYIPPTWGGEQYLFGTYVHIEAALFFLFGQQILLMAVVNAVAMVAASVLILDLTDRMFGRRAALLAGGATAFFPSLILWSALNLKDALSLLLITGTLWLLTRAREPGRAWLALVALVLLLPMESLRRYTFVLLALLIPVAVVVLPARLRVRAVRTSLSLIASGGLLLIDLTGSSWLQPNLAQLEQFRLGLGQGARTSYQDPAPVQVRTGDLFLVVGAGMTAAAKTQAPATSPPTSTPGPTAAAGAATATSTMLATRAPTAAVAAAVQGVAPAAEVTAGAAVAEPILVPPDSTIVIVPSGEPLPSTAQGTVFVRPGDLVAIGSIAPSSEPKPLAAAQVAPGDAGELTAAIRLTDGDVVRRTLRYLPKGVVYALFAPMPWQISRMADLLTVPEMLLWYVLSAAALVTTWQRRREWRDLLPLVLFVTGVLAIFSLVEGNAGTLFRHRAMIVPAVAALAAPTLLGAWERLGRRASPLLARVSRIPPRTIPAGISGRS